MAQAMRSWASKERRPRFFGEGREFPAVVEADQAGGNAGVTGAGEFLGGVLLITVHSRGEGGPLVGEAATIRATPLPTASSARGPATGGPAGS